MNTSTTRSIVAALLLTVLQIATAYAQTPAPPPASDQSQQLLKAEELDQLVAPIALYPDTLLAEVLMASTYPLEVVQADRWATANKALKGDQLKAAVDKQSWDDSVKSLVATPSVLAMMSEKLDWTQKLGDAVLAQQPDVMDAVQRLRTQGPGQQQAGLDQGTEGLGDAASRASRSSSSNQPCLTRFTCLITILPSFTATGPIPPIRPITSRRRSAMCRARSSLPELHSAQATRSDAGHRAATTGAAASTGAATTSTSTARSTSTTSMSAAATTGSTIPSTARA